MHALFLALLLAPAWQHGFEAGAETARSYHAEGTQPRLTYPTEGAAEGVRYLRAELPGERKLEGFRVEAAGLPGGRRATVTARVRGQGELWLCLYSRNGWLYAPQTTPLGATWTEVSLTKVLAAADAALSINFLAQEVQPGAVFEVDDVRIELAAPPVVSDQEVGPWRLEAEDHAGRPEFVGREPGAEGGAVRGERYAALADLPFPRTSRPVTIAALVRAEAGGELRAVTRQGGPRQVVATAKVAPQAAWGWVYLPPLTAGEVGDALDLELAGPGLQAIDAVLLGTTLTADSATSATPWSPGALVAVGQGPPPLLDGLGNEPAWQAAIALQGFRTVRGLAPAEGGTTARLRFDQNNLYLLFECDEPILSVAQQRTHEFRTRGEADGPLWNDDSVVVLLAPPGGPVVDLFVNGAGTIADARCPEADLWGKRDTSWQSGAQAAVHRADGRWGLELAIPFAPLGGKPTAGTRWGIQLGRLAAARGESSSWSPCPVGFHDAASFGTLVFAAEVPGLELAAPAILEPGGNPLKLTVHPATGAGGLLLRTSLSGARRQALSHYVPAGATALEAVVDPSGESAPEVDYRVLDAATLQPLLQTAPAVQRVSLARAALTLTATGPWELHLNDQLLARGEQAKEQALNLPLRRGPNRLELRSESGVPVATLALPNAAPRAVRWKLQPTAETSGSEDRWPTAPQQHSGRAVLRHTILWEKTRLWPKPDPAVYICRESNQHLTFIADGLPGRALPDYRVHLRLPAGYQVVGSTGYYGHQPQQPHFTCAAGPDGTVTIAADEPLGSGRHPIMSLFNVLVRPAADAADGELIWWCEASDGTVTEAPQTVPLRLLGRVDGRQPKRLVCQMWGSFFSAMDDPAMRAAGLELMRASGVTDIVAGDALTTELAHRQGLTHTLGVKFVSWSLNLRPYLEQHPEQRLLDQQGKPQPELLCTSLLLGDSWAPVEEQLALLLAKVKPDTVDYDFEYSPLTGPHSCYCERCLTAFRTAAGLDQALALTPASIAAQHEAAWTDFMCQQVARVMARLKESVHQLAPGTRFSVYSGYQTATNPRQYGLDWRYVGALRACDRAGCGYGRPAEELTPTLDALGEIPVLYGELLNPYDTAKDEPVRPLARAHLLRRYLDSTGGLLVYDRLPMDGRCWQALADVNRLVADHEALFISGRLVALPGLSEDEGDSLTDGRTTLVCLFNPTSRTVVRKLALPAEAGAGQEYYRGHRVQAGEQVEVELTPGEIAVYILRRK